ncbi:MAG: SUMF1/EgtB/PvdO family nonheme iron enzyme [Treponema sp.]|jgi:uncharacterized repeat protein (TIGR02543 family)|nr:SUMF1/EgtB/PvdO family nonheme iron enzyme [Treponema sp.]
MKTTRLSGFIIFLTVIGVLLIACDDGRTTTYTVTFNANGSTGGTAPSAMSTNETASITLPGQGSLVKTGYSFGGWNTSADGSGTTYAAGASYTVTGNVTLYVKWDVVNAAENMVWINPGTFTRNSYTITLTSGFYMGKYEVTQEQYRAVIGNNPSYYNSSPATGELQGRRPVEQVSWYNAIVFCNKLSMIEGLTPAYRINGSTDPSLWGAVPTSSNTTWDAVQIVAGSTGYRLPTEAQWEYACRAGTTTTWSFDVNASDLTNYAWYDANSNARTHEVGKKLPNAWGLYDMHGNVWEWCWDWYGSLPNTAQTDPAGAASGSARLFRGGSWYNSAENTASAYRYHGNPYDRNFNYGFRLLRPYTSQSVTAYTVTFDSNGSTGGTVPAAVNAYQNVSITLPGQGNLVRTGYTFAGWNTAANGSGTTYAAGSSHTVTGNATLYAKWDAIINTVTFNANGSTGGTVPSAMSANQNASITLPDKGNLVKTGYAFGGWNTAANGSGTAHAAGSSFTVTGNVTLYAKWDVIINTVTFNANGSTGGTTPAAMSANQYANITLPNQGNLVKTGCIFSGWTAAADGSGTTYAAGSSFTVTGNVTLYAKWDAVMVWINPGTFTRDDGNTITLTSGFYMGKYEVTQGQYQAVMGNNPSYFSSSPAPGEVQGRRPVEQVSWYNAVEFCNALSVIEGLTSYYNIDKNTTDPNNTSSTDGIKWLVTTNASANGYRLPTEAQWEYACRAGTTTTWSFGDNQSSLTNYAWYSAYSSGRTHEVGKKLPNAWGLYDMHGNVREWCWDWYDSLPNTAQTDPTGAVSGSNRLMRGGGWDYSAEYTASAYRDNGFRLLRP